MKKDPPERKISFISPVRQTLEIDGDMSYGEGQRSWSVIRLKKTLIQEFPQLQNRREKFGYKMILHREYKELKKTITEMEKNKQPIPLFLMIGKKKVESSE